MGVLANLIVRISGATDDFDKKLDRSTRKLQRFGTDMQAAGRAVTFGVSVPLAGLGAVALKVAGDMEQAGIAFGTMMKSEQAAAKHLGELRDFALKTPFQFMELVDASRRMQALGFSAQEVIPKLRTIGNAVGALGGGADVLNRIILALSQIKAKGTAQAEEMRQLAEAGIPAWEALSKKLGVDIPTAMKMVEQRTVDANTAITAMLDVMDQRFAGGMERQAQGWNGMLSNLKDAVTFTLADIGKVMLPFGKQMIRDVLQPMLDKSKELAKAFSDLHPAAQKATLGFSAIAIALPPLVWMTGTLITNFGVIAGALNKVSGAIGGFGVALRAIPFVGIAAGVGYLLDKFNDPNKISTTDKALQNLSRTMRENGTIATQTAKPFDAIIGYIKEIDAKAAPAKKSQKALRTAVQEAGEAVEVARVQWMGLAETLSLIERDKAGKALEEQWLSIMRGGGTRPDQVLDLPAFNLPSIEPAADEVEKVIQGIVLDQGAWNEALKRGEEQFGKVEKAAKKTKQPVSELGRQVSTIMTDMSRGITDLIFRGGKFKDIWVGTLQEIGKAFTRYFIEQGINAAIKALTGKGGLMESLSGVASGIGKLFGDGRAGDAGYDAFAKYGTGGAMKIGGGGGATAGASGLMGTLGAVGSIGSMVSGVIGNFQMRGMNKSLDLIVKHTLQTANQLIYGIQPQLNTYLPGLQPIEWSLNSINQILGGLNDTVQARGGAGGGVTIHIHEASSARETAKEVAKILKIQSVAFA